MTATDPALNTTTTLEEIKAAVRQLTPEQREDLREELAFLAHIDSPEFRRRIGEGIDRMEAGERYSLDDFIRENAPPAESRT